MLSNHGSSSRQASLSSSSRSPATDLSYLDRLPANIDRRALRRKMEQQLADGISMDLSSLSSKLIALLLFR